ncbi:LAFE_0B09824g1_1 [Lachancea fermentati]|uniref:LAFE_0B09824g1_1 n=1 Tax=Lachancea fermentati TaxID=4955 RepID=A0A1G4M8D9_LACFM|nr:LAFE_0B09824g1_1 [Lachancea fermentati]
MTSKPPSSIDEGPKLREEKQYQDFYPNLCQQTTLPVLVDNEGDQNDSMPTLPHPHIKQIIFKDKVTVEPIASNADRVQFKKCKVRISDLSGSHGITKQYYRFGYRHNRHPTKFDENTTPYIKKTDYLEISKEDPFVQISKYQSHFQVQYDMDEQDELYLRFLNTNRITYMKRRITHEIFEIVITVLENEWFYLEKKIPPRVSPNADIYSKESKAAWQYYEAYGSDDGTGYVLDQPCAICGGTESDNSNAIVFCDGCDVAVHQECYGVVFIPEGQWLCRRCMISRNRKINCLFCPSHTGAFKQTDTGSWGHVICGIWIPELFFANTHYMEPIEGVALISKSRWKLNCYICKQKMGACIQCSNKNCFTAYHVTCAKRAGLCLDFGGCSISDAASNSFSSAVKLQSFCDKHSPPGWNDCREGIQKTRRYFGSINEVKVLEQSRDDSRTKKGSGCKWKTNRGTPIAPHIFAQVVRKVLDSFKIENTERLAIEICKYWSMKRELKRGTSLVRKFDPTAFNTFRTEEIQERVNFAEILLNDMNKLHELGSLLVKRQLASKSLHEAKAKCDQIAHHPVAYLIKTSVLDNITKTQAYKSLLRNEALPSNLNTILSRCDSGYYDSISSFKKDISEYFKEIASNTKISRTTQMLANSVFAGFKERLARIEGIDVQTWINEDFDIHGSEINLAKWKGPKLMEKEDLSDVEELSPGEIRIIKACLK